MVDFLLAHFWASSNLIHCSFSANDFLFHFSLHLAESIFISISSLLHFIVFCFMLLWTVHTTHQEITFLISFFRSSLTRCVSERVFSFTLLLLQLN